jgi:membrane protein DedA with SNARE-associated domain
MDLASLLHSYGYLLIFLGTVAEGESLLVLGGYFAQQGYLQLGGVMLTAYVGAVCGDQLFFYLGRHHAKRLLARFPKLRERVNVALTRVEQHQVKVVLTMRFLWGLRIALPVSLGLTNMRWPKYFALDLLSAAVWATLFSLVGYFAGELFNDLIADLRKYEYWIAGVLVLAAVIAFIWHAGRPRQTKAPEQE